MSPDRRIRQRVVVHGHVQGVFFRDGVRDAADDHHVAGWARNCEDGTLEAVFEGTAADVQALIDYCHQGPEGARVQSVDVEDQEPSGLEGFAVR